MLSANVLKMGYKRTTEKGNGDETESSPAPTNIYRTKSRFLSLTVRVQVEQMRLEGRPLPLVHHGHLDVARVSPGAGDARLHVVKADALGPKLGY